MQILSNILAFIVVAGVVIFVHEAGHYVVAKAFGVRVLTFSLGFGKRIWGFRRGDTDYRVSIIPLGGYVSFFGQDPYQQTDAPDAFVNQPRWQRILIYLAGPAMNALLAIVLVAAVFIAGTDITNERDLSTEIGGVAQGLPAAQAGLLAGDRIVEIDGEPMDDWAEVHMTVVTSPERALSVVYERDGERMTTTMVPLEIPKHELGEAGIRSSAPPRVREVLAGSPAQQAGLRFGDILLAVNDRPIATIEDFQAAVQPLAGAEARIQIERDGEVSTVVATPRDEGGQGVVGIIISQFHFQRLAPLPALQASLRYNWDLTKDIFFFVGQVFERRISAQSALGGPVQIAQISGAAARSGARTLVFFMALISLNLCILNLAPVPILDGGQIVILAIESTLRRDLSLRVKERVTQLGLVMIVLLMVMALYFDLIKSLPVGG